MKTLEKNESFFDLPAVKLAKSNPNLSLAFRTREFSCVADAETSFSALESDPAVPAGCVAVKHVPATVSERTEKVRRSIKGSAMATLQRAIDGGDPIAQPAIDWAIKSVWNDGCELEYMIPCLEADLADGDANGAASVAQAEKFLKRLKAAVRYQDVTEVKNVNIPEKWIVKFMVNTNFGPDVAGPWAKH